MMQDAPPGWRLQIHLSLGSTQDEAIAAAHAADPGRLAILAQLQTAGHGSRGRQWAGASGNLHLSTLLRPNGARPNPGALALMAGVVLHDAVAGTLQTPETLALKWPNDLLLGGVKLGGILIDSTVAADGTVEWVVIGFGLNVAAAPKIEGRQTACLNGLVETRPVTDLATAIMAGLDQWVQEPNAVIVDAWLARAHPIGTWLEITTGTQRRAGIFDGLASDGSLLLAEQSQPISSGEVFVSGGAR